MRNDMDIEKALEVIQNDVKTLLTEVGKLKGAVTVTSALVGAVVAGAIVAILAGCAQHPQPQPRRALSAQEVGAAVVAVVVDGQTICAAFNTPVGVMTAAHCVHEEPAVVETGEGRRYELPVVRLDVAGDTALLGAMPGPVLHVRPRPPRLDERVLAVGHPAGQRYTYSRGEVSRETRGSGGHPRLPLRFFLVSAQIAPGFSGGPLVDARGDVLGINSFVLYWNVSGIVPPPDTSAP